MGQLRVGQSEKDEDWKEEEGVHEDQEAPADSGAGPSTWSALLDDNGGELGDAVVKVVQAGWKRATFRGVMNIADHLYWKIWDVVDERGENRKLQGQYDEVKVELAQEKHVSDELWV